MAATLSAPAGSVWLNDEARYRPLDVESARVIPDDAWIYGYSVMSRRKKNTTRPYSAHDFVLEKVYVMTRVSKPEESWTDVGTELAGTLKAAYRDRMTARGTPNKNWLRDFEEIKQEWRKKYEEKSLPKSFISKDVSKFSHCWPTIHDHQENLKEDQKTRAWATLLEATQGSGSEGSDSSEDGEEHDALPQSPSGSEAGDPDYEEEARVPAPPKRALKLSPLAARESNGSELDYGSSPEAARGGDVRYEKNSSAGSPSEGHGAKAGELEEQSNEDEAGEGSKSHAEPRRSAGLLGDILDHGSDDDDLFDDSPPRRPRTARSSPPNTPSEPESHAESFLLKQEPGLTELLGEDTDRSSVDSARHDDNEVQVMGERKQSSSRRGTAFVGATANEAYGVEVGHLLKVFKTAAKTTFFTGRVIKIGPQPTVEQYVARVLFDDDLTEEDVVLWGQDASLWEHLKDERGWLCRSARKTEGQGYLGEEKVYRLKGREVTQAVHAPQLGADGSSTFAFYINAPAVLDLQLGCGDVFFFSRYGSSGPSFGDLVSVDASGKAKISGVCLGTAVPVNVLKISTMNLDEILQSDAAMTILVEWKLKGSGYPNKSFEFMTTDNKPWSPTSKQPPKILAVSRTEPQRYVDVPTREDRIELIGTAGCEKLTGILKEWPVFEFLRENKLFSRDGRSEQVVRSLMTGQDQSSTCSKLPATGKAMIQQAVNSIKAGIELINNTEDLSKDGQATELLNFGRQVDYVNRLATNFPLLFQLNGIAATSIAKFVEATRADMMPDLPPVRSRRVQDKEISNPLGEAADTSKPSGKADKPPSKSKQAAKPPPVTRGGADGRVRKDAKTGEPKESPTKETEADARGPKRGKSAKDDDDGSALGSTAATKLFSDASSPEDAQVSVQARPMAPPFMGAGMTPLGAAVLASSIGTPSVKSFASTSSSELFTQYESILKRIDEVKESMKAPVKLLEAELAAVRAELQQTKLEYHTVNGQLIQAKQTIEHMLLDSKAKDQLVSATEARSKEVWNAFLQLAKVPQSKSQS